MAGQEAPILIFRQLSEKASSTYTYLLAAALLIDPADKTADRDLNLIKDAKVCIQHTCPCRSCDWNRASEASQGRQLLPEAQDWTLSALPEGHNSGIIIVEAMKFVSVLNYGGHNSGIIVIEAMEDTECRRVSAVAIARNFFPCAASNGLT